VGAEPDQPSPADAVNDSAGTNSARVPESYTWPLVAIVIVILPQVLVPNPYVLGPSVDVSQRRSLETGALGVFAVNAASGAEAARLMARSAVGRRGRDPGWHEFTCESFEVRSQGGSAFAGVDGEALDMPTPLRFRIHPRGMRVLVPESNLEIAARRRARNVSVKALLAAARGKTGSTDEMVED